MVASPTFLAAKAVPFTREPFLLGSYQAFLQDRLGFLSGLTQKGNVIGFHIGPVPMLLFNQAEHAQYILVEHADDFSKGKLMRRAVGNNGLFVSDGAFHLKQRKLMAPCFQSRHIASYADTIVSYAGHIMQKWEDGAVIDINRPIFPSARDRVSA